MGVNSNACAYSIYALAASSVVEYSSNSCREEGQSTFWKLGRRGLEKDVLCVMVRETKKIVFTCNAAVFGYVMFIIDVSTQKAIVFNRRDLTMFADGFKVAGCPEAAKLLKGPKAVPQMAYVWNLPPNMAKRPRFLDTTRLASAIQIAARDYENIVKAGQKPSGGAGGKQGRWVVLPAEKHRAIRITWNYFTPLQSPCIAQIQ